MQYIAIALDYQLHLTDNFLSEIEILVHEYGYEVAYSLPSFNSTGVSSFILSKNISNFIYIIYPSHKSLPISSSGISDELFESYLNGVKSNFENFLEKLCLILNQNFYIAFFETWEDYTYTKYYEGKIHVLTNLLELNRGWKTLLFNFMSNSFSYDSELPLIFRVIISDIIPR